MTSQAAAEEYIESKRNVLSPSTIRSYDTIRRQPPKAFLEKNIHDVTALDVQAEINRLSKKCSPKTVRNYHGFISAVLGTFYPELKIYTTMPQKEKMSHIFLLLKISKKYWNVPVIQNLKSLSC